LIWRWPFLLSFSFSFMISNMRPVSLALPAGTGGWCKFQQMQIVCALRERTIWLQF
jgi:hypothetical protein